MRKSHFKWALIGGVLVAVLMFGMEMTTGGINRVYGPIEGSQPGQVGRLAEAAKAKEQLQQLQRLQSYEAELHRLQQKYGIKETDTPASPDSFTGDSESTYTERHSRARE